jgi:flagella basal body P-ring formation protein FlgA
MSERSHLHSPLATYHLPLNHDQPNKKLDILITRHSTMKRFIQVAVSAAAWCGLACSLNGAEITLKPRVVNPGSLVLLADIADIEGVNGREIESLGRVELFPAPAAGASRTVRRREIRELLRLNGIDLRRHEFGGAEAVHIAPRLRQPFEKIEAPPKTEPTQQYFVAPVRDMIRGDIIRAVDVSLMDQPQNTVLPHQTLRLVEDVVEMEVVRDLKAGQPLEPGMVRRPILVRQNETITVVSRAAGVEARTTAKATQHGAHGDLIVVQSLHSREKYAARVTGPKQAEVFASGVVVASSPPPPQGDVSQRPSTRNFQ